MSDTLRPESPYLNLWADDLTPILIRQLARVADAQGDGDKIRLFAALTVMKTQIDTVLAIGYADELSEAEPWTPEQTHGWMTGQGVEK